MAAAAAGACRGRWSHLSTGGPSVGAVGVRRYLMRFQTVGLLAVRGAARVTHLRQRCWCGGQEGAGRLGLTHSLPDRHQNGGAGGCGGGVEPCGESLETRLQRAEDVGEACGYALIAAAPGMRSARGDRAARAVRGVPAAVGGGRARRCRPTCSSLTAAVSCAAHATIHDRPSACFQAQRTGTGGEAGRRADGAAATVNVRRAASCGCDGKRQSRLPIARLAAATAAGDRARLEPARTAHPATHGRWWTARAPAGAGPAHLHSLPCT